MICSLIVKASLIFGKRFMIFKTVNHFLKLNSSSLHARLISDHQNLAIVDRRNPVGAGVRQHPVVGILPAPEFGHWRTKFQPEYCRILAKPARSGQNGRDPAGSGRICLLIRSLIRPDVAGFR
jgi:hypothetical protein